MADRKLTPAEEKRKERFDDICAELYQRDYDQTELIATASQANVLGVLYGLIVAVPFIVIFFLDNTKDEISSRFGIVPMLIFVIAIIASLVIHELIHGTTWSFFTKNHWKSIEFGVIWQSLNPYCTCSEPLTKRAYITGLLMPCILLGFIPSILAIFTGNFMLLFFGVLEIMSAGGDIFVLLLILKHHTATTNCIYMDHPTKIGLVCFEKINTPKDDYI